MRDWLMLNGVRSNGAMEGVSGLERLVNDEGHAFMGQLYLWEDQETGKLHVLLLSGSQGRGARRAKSVGGARKRVWRGTDVNSERARPRGSCSANTSARKKWYR
jgi:hypothetical protein